MAKSILIQLLSFYQNYIRVFLPKLCRFEPSCSEYSRQAISKFGIRKGLLLAILRLLRCHPFNRHVGYDPVKDEYPNSEIRIWRKE